MGDWRGFSPKEMADRMAKRAVWVRGTCSSHEVATDRLLDEGADLIVHQAAEIAELRAALDPFQWHIIPDGVDDDDEDLLLVRWADVRRARAALTRGR